MTKIKRKKRVMWWHNYYRCKDCGYSNNLLISATRHSKGHIFESECAECGQIGDMKFAKTKLRKYTDKMLGIVI